MGLAGFLEHLRSAAQKIVGLNDGPAQEREAGRLRTVQLLPRSAPPRPHATPPTAPGLKGLAWLGPGTTVRIGNGAVEVRDPLAYFHAEQLASTADEPAAINLQLPIGNHPQQPIGQELSYWPRYGQLTPNQRRLYLDWLACSRSVIPSELGYTFLFIYGLERRALLERQDVKLIFKEILRLRDLYKRSNQPVSRSFERYTSSFLWCLLLREPDVLAERHFMAAAKSFRHWGEEGLACALSWLGRANKPLPDWLAFSLASQLPKSQRSVVTKRVGNELRDLFVKRYRAEFSSGFLMKSAKRERKFSYRPASGALTLIEMTGPDPMGVISQFNPLSEIWNNCISDLKRLSTAVGASNGGPISTATWNAMPAELQAQVDHPLIDQFARFIEEHTGDSPQTIVSARAVATLVGIPADSKLTAIACRRMTDTVANVGYCLEPDPNITERGYEDEEPVVLFLNLDGAIVDSARYMVASTMLNIGVALSMVDGHLHESELVLLKEQINSAFKLNEHEERRLSMLRMLRIARGIELSDAIRPLKRLELGDRERVARFALAMIAADGVVTKEELKAVRRLYAGLGFDRNSVDIELAALMAKPSQGDDPVTVMPAMAGTKGEAIPAFPVVASSKSLRLDRNAINAILKDTSEVAQMLADAMDLDAQSDPSGTISSASVVHPKADAAATDIIATDNLELPSQYSAFFNSVLSQPHWMRPELASLAQQHGLMLAGAVDAINDWSTEKNGGPLIYDDGQQFTLETAYLS